MTTTSNSPVAIALVHGGFVDGSGWEADVAQKVGKIGAHAGVPPQRRRR